MSRDADTFTQRPQSRLQKSNSSLSVAPKDPAASKFAFWRSKPATNVDKCNVVEDEIAELDMQTALFPAGTIDDSSPEEFKKLRTNAEITIRRLQAAYQESLESIREVNSEKNVLKDELEAAQTRSEHLKLQLAKTVAQSATQESAMHSMAEELAAARHKIREDARFRRKRLRIVTNESYDEDDARSMTKSPRRRKRHSAESSASEDSSSDSIFSHAPPGTCTPVSITADTNPDILQEPTFGAITIKECQNCHGVKRSEAWDVVQVLKEESKALKARIAQCESANEDALRLLDVAAVR
jgi:hypothetical protein